MASRSLGTLTIDMVADVVKFVDGMDKAQRATAKTEEQLKKTQKSNEAAVNRMLSALDKQAKTVHMTAGELKIYELAARGATAAQIEQARASINVIAAHEKEQNALKGKNRTLADYAKGAAAAALVGISARSILDSAEAYTTISNRLKLVTDSTDSYREAQENVFRIAQTSRQSLTGTAELYQRIATNQDALKLSGQGVADVVETISKAMVVSGTSAASANAALVQLGQAFASGTLRGEELNSVMEQAPALSKAIADGLGVSVGKLREMGKEGELTAEAVIAALQKQAEAIDEQFGSMAVTVGGAWQTTANSMTNAIGKFDEATGTTAALGNAILSVSHAVDAVAGSPAILNAIADAAALVAIALGSKLSAGAAASALSFAAMQREAFLAQVALARTSGVSATAATTMAATAAAARSLSAAMALAGGPVGAIMLAAGAVAYFATRTSEADKESAALDERINRLGDSFDRLTVNQAREAIQDYEVKLSQATREMEKAEARAFTLKDNLARFPNSAKVEQWQRDLISAEASIDTAKQSVDAINGSLLQLNAIVNAGGAKAMGDHVASESEAYAKLNKQLQERLAITGLQSEAEKLQARINGGFVDGLLEGEGEKLVAIQKEIDARENAAKAAAEADKNAERAARQAASDSKKAAAEAEREAKRLAKEQERAAEELARNQQQNVDQIAQLEEQLYQASLGAEELARRQAELQANEYATPEQIERLKELASELYEVQKAQKADRSFNSGIGEFDPLKGLADEYESKKEMLDDWLEYEKISQEEHQQYLAKLREEYADLEREERERKWAEESELNEFMLDAVDNFSQAATDAITGLIDGSMTAQEAMASLGQSILSHAVSALAQVGAEILANTIKDTIFTQTKQANDAVQTASELSQIATIQAASTAATTASVATQAAAATATAVAWTPAAIVSSIGSFGAAAAVGLAAVLAAMSGFRSGGYTGGGGEGEIAGVVHGQEFVLNAATTRRIGVSNLERLNSGGTLATAGGSVVQNIQVAGSMDNKTATQLANRTSKQQRRASRLF